MDNPHPISIAALATGLVDDLKQLFNQEVRLARHEMQLEVRKLLLSLLQAALGLLLSLLAITFLLIMAVHLLYTYASLPLWACYGLVGLLALALGAVFLYSLLKLGSSLRLWPFHAVHSIKEDARWIKEQLLSIRT